MCGFIAQLVEHRTGIAEVTGSNPVKALVFFRLLLSNYLSWKINCDDHSSLSVIVIQVQWNPDFTNLQGRRKLVRKIGEFEKSGVKRQCSTEEGKRLLFELSGGS